MAKMTERGRAAMKANGVRVGRRNVAAKRGIFAPGFQNSPRMKQVRREIGKAVARRMKDEKRGIFALTPEDRRRIGKRAGEIVKARGVGICDPAVRARGAKLGAAKGGRATMEKKVAIFAPGMASKAARAANKKNWADPVYRERMHWRGTPYL